MVIFELRDAAYDTAFDLLDEAKLNAKKTKLTLCELEDAIYECYEASKEEEYPEYEETEPEMEFRGRSGMRSNYRHDDRDMYDEDEMNTRSGMRRSSRRRGMRMRSGMRRGY